ncbi:MAG: ATP-binding protein, partial [Marinirhabdus sp.]
ANANGGVICVGKDDNGTIIGLDKPKKLMGELPNKIRDTLGILCQVDLYSRSGKDFIEIRVDSSSSPISYRGKFYLRSGSTNQLLNGQALTDFLLKRAGKDWDEIIEPKASFDDIDTGAIELFRQSSLKTGRLPFLKDETDPKKILRKLRLIDNNGDYTKASVILFGNDPITFNGSAFLKIGKFGDTSSVLLAQDVIEGNAFGLADKTIEVLDKKYFIRKVGYKGLQRVETPEYPYAAIREVLFNAIVHRVYELTPITVRIYEDRVEVWNFGELPQQLTPKDLKEKHDSFPRNKLLADVFYKGGHIEAWGRGTIKVIEECEKYGLSEPLIEERNGGVSVTIFKDIYNKKYISHLDINVRQKKAIQYVKENGGITNAVYREEYKVTDRTAHRDIEELVDLSILKKEGAGRATKYLIDVSGYKGR